MLTSRRESPDQGLRALVGAALLAVTLLLTGCGSAKKPESLAERTTIYGFSLSDYQRKILADGVVTEAEYRAAVEADRDCVIHEGVYAGPITLAPNGVHLSFGVGGCSAGENCEAIRAAGEAAFDKCGSEYVSAVEAALSNQSIPTGAEAEREFDKVAACLAKAGVIGVQRSDKEVDVYQRIARALPDENSLARGAADDCMQATFLYWTPFPVNG